jgi:hypothetical protein
MDQMSRDLRQAGYPNPRNVSLNVLDQIPTKNDKDAAVGVVKVDTGDLWFEGDVDGTGTVSVIRYHLDTDTANGCPCLKRSQLPKINADPLTAQTTESYQVEVQGVQNTVTTPIFQAFNDGVAVGLPVTTATGSGNTMAGVDTIQATLTLQALTVDPRTRQRPVTTLITTVKLNNCSQSATGESMSCR